MIKQCKQCSKDFITNKSIQNFCCIACGLFFRRDQRKDINIFNNLDLISAYILGYIFADGSISIYESNKKIVKRFSLSGVDKEIIEKIHQIITPNKKLYFKKPVGTGLCKNSITKELYSISSCQEDLINSLLLLGVTPNKSYNMKFPTIPENLYWSFIRGYFDGDGCVYKATKEHNVYLCIKFTSGSFEFLSKLQTFLSEKSISSTIDQDKRSMAFGLTIRKKQDVFLFYKNLYKDNTLFMERKKMIFDNFYEENLQKVLLKRYDPKASIPLIFNE